MIKLTATIQKLDGTLINIDYRNLLSLDREIKDRSDITLPTFGVISNGGNLQFVDYDSSMKKLIEQRLAKSGMEVSVYLENTSAKLKSNIGNFITDKWKYDDNRKVSISLVDSLIEWQSIPFSNVIFASTDELMYAKPEEIYEYLYNRTPSKYNMMSFDELDIPTRRAICYDITLFRPVFILNAENLWSAWNQYCQAYRLHIFSNNGRTICKFNGGN